MLYGVHSALLGALSHFAVAWEHTHCIPKQFLTCNACIMVGLLSVLHTCSLQAGAYFSEELHSQLVDALLEYGEKQLVGWVWARPVWKGVLPLDLQRFEPEP